MRLLVYCIGTILFLVSSQVTGKKSDGLALIEQIAELKDFKKLIRTKTNVMVLYSKSARDAAPFMKLYGEVAEEIKGQATLAHIDCSGDGKKLCRKHKVTPEPISLKHYKDGAYHKDYDRRETVQSMVNFLKDPTGEAPWDEDETASELVHISNTEALAKLLHKERHPILFMFYAPWCGFCKRLKPDFAAAATELKGQAVLAAMDVNKPENAVVRRHFNITGFPTLLYFENGNLKMRYEGENTKEGIVKFMRNPIKQPVEKPKEADWFEGATSVAMLTESNFDNFLKQHGSVLVMFFAPWCGHCKKMKPELVLAANQIQQLKIPGKIAAVDATKEKSLAEKHQVTSYPTTKYFKDGKFEFDVSYRTADKIQDFMANPQAPPPPPPPEVPWHEMPDTNVHHLTEDTFKTFLRRKKHVLTMFYAPWCGHCKKAKPEFEATAAKFKDDPKVELAAVDCTAYPQLCSGLDVKAYPTFLYFNYYNKKQLPYEGGRTEDDFVQYLHNLAHPAEQSLASLDDSSLPGYLTRHPHVLVMFHTPECGPCQSLMPELSEASATLQQKKVNAAKVVTVDAALAKEMARIYSVKSYPSLKYFRNGKLEGDYTKPRTSQDIVSFLSSQLRRDEL